MLNERSERKEMYVTIEDIEIQYIKTLKYLPYGKPKLHSLTDYNWKMVRKHLRGTDNNFLKEKRKRCKIQ